MDLDLNTIELSPSQARAYDSIMDGKSVLITGPAGTGKSVLMRKVIHDLRVLYGGQAVAVTAFTGIAAVNIGGTTLHSWAGVGLGREDMERLPWKVRRFPAPRARWESVRVLVIDEISMLDGLFFDKLEYVARELRKDQRPFGGIQLVCCGDFAQLPPIPDPNTSSGEFEFLFAFEGTTWRTCVPHLIFLKEVFRQKDEALLRILKAVRTDTVTESDERKLRRLMRTVRYYDDVEPTELFGTRDEVGFANGTRLQKLAGPEYKYTAADYPNAEYFEKHITERELTFKVGAQVMIVKNFADQRLFNGVVGKVIDFQTWDMASQDPSITVLQPYIRAPDDPEKSHPPLLYTKQKVGKVKMRGNDRVWPVVQLTDDRKVLCLPVQFITEDMEGNVEGCREQVPLILAWAITIHKSQGQTIKRLKVNLNRVWAEGQVYVALSRATDLDNLQVLNFDRSKVRVNDRVVDFYRVMEMGLA